MQGAAATSGAEGKYLEMGGTASEEGLPNKSKIHHCRRSHGCDPLEKFTEVLQAGVGCCGARDTLGSHLQGCLLYSWRNCPLAFMLQSKKKKKQTLEPEREPLPLAVLFPDNAMTVSAGCGEMFLGSSTSITKTEQRRVIWG